MKIDWIYLKNNTFPKAEQIVILLCKDKYTKYEYKCFGFYEPQGVLREQSEYSWDFECCDDYSEEYDDYFVNSGWYERIYNWDLYGCVKIEDEVIAYAYIDEELNEVETW